MPRRPRRNRYQVTLTLMSGAEPWIRVEHSWGWFVLPATVSVQELLTGVAEHWQRHAPRTLSHAPATVRVPLVDWLDMISKAASAGRSEQQSG